MIRKPSNGTQLQFVMLQKKKKNNGRGQLRTQVFVSQSEINNTLHHQIRFPKRTRT